MYPFLLLGEKEEIFEIVMELLEKSRLFSLR
jgi:hypothetical protein